MRFEKATGCHCYQEIPTDSSSVALKCMAEDEILNPSKQMITATELRNYPTKRQHLCVICQQ